MIWVRSDVFVGSSSSLYSEEKLSLREECAKGTGDLVNAYFNIIS
jgi:hypothetical protein